MKVSLTFSSPRYLLMLVAALQLQAEQSDPLTFTNSSGSEWSNSEEKHLQTSQRALSCLPYVSPIWGFCKIKATLMTDFTNQTAVGTPNCVSNMQLDCCMIELSIVYYTSEKNFKAGEVFI